MAASSSASGRCPPGPSEPLRPLAAARRIYLARGFKPSDEISNGQFAILPNQVYLGLMAALVVTGARAVGRGAVGPSALADAAATLFAPIYIGLGYMF